MTITDHHPTYQPETGNFDSQTSCRTYERLGEIAGHVDECFKRIEHLTSGLTPVLLPKSTENAVPHNDVPSQMESPLDEKLGILLRSVCSLEDQLAALQKRVSL